MADGGEIFVPTISFGFILKAKEKHLHQMWVDQWGHIEWRPVPMIREGVVKNFKAAVAGYVPEDEEGVSDE